MDKHAAPADSPESPAATRAEAALLPVFERLRPSLQRFFERRVGAGIDAEDLVQEVFVHLARHGAATEIHQPERYVFQVATNVLRDYGRYAVSRQRSNHISLDEEEWVGEAPSEERIYAGRELLAQVMVVLDELTPKCRTVFLLHRFEGLSYGEIARRFGVSSSAVEKHMMHAIQVISERFPD